MRDVPVPKADRPHATACVALLAAAGVVAACAGVGGEVRTQAVIWFDAYNEVFTGVATRRGSILGGGFLDLQNADRDIRCVGKSELRIVPPAARPMTHCDGMQGMATLSCSDGRMFQVEYHVEEGCLTGYGSGQDDEGHALHAVFGGSEDYASMMAREAGDHLKGRPRLPRRQTRAGTNVGAVPPSTGTAFFVTWEGHLVTNHHVIVDHKRIQVSLGEGNLIDAEVIGVDRENDLAILRVEAIRRPLKLHAEQDLSKGDEVFALGYPMIALQGQEQKATFGRVNALSGIQGDERFAQIDVPIQPGNSGGPLLNRRGEVVGVVTQMLDPKAVMRAAGVVPQNVNYALKSWLVRDVLVMSLGEDWTPEIERQEERDFAPLVSDAQASVVLVVAW